MCKHVLWEGSCGAALASFSVDRASVSGLKGPEFDPGFVPALPAFAKAPGPGGLPSREAGRGRKKLLDLLGLRARDADGLKQFPGWKGAGIQSSEHTPSHSSDSISNRARPGRPPGQAKLTPGRRRPRPGPWDLCPVLDGTSLTARCCLLSMALGASRPHRGLKPLSRVFSVTHVPAARAEDAGRGLGSGRGAVGAVRSPRGAHSAEARPDRPRPGPDTAG